MIDSVVILELLLLATVVLYTNIVTLFSAWVVAGLYLVGIGLLTLVNEGDILVGFLWLIDFGVGLVFLTFVVYLFAFLSQRASSELPVRFYMLASYFIIFLFTYLYALSFPSNDSGSTSIQTFAFYISWYDYYDFFNLESATDLLILRGLYFHTNSLEFFLISVLGLYGIIACVLTSLVIKRSIHYFSKNLYDSLEFTRKPHSSSFIRNQNFLKQRNTTAGSRVWYKRRSAAPSIKT